MAKKRLITEEEKQFIRDIFKWFQQEAIKEGIVSRKWKDDLIDYIWEEMKAEGKEVKKASIRRNLNRMLAYYYNTGAQARSGKRYLKYIEKFLRHTYEQYLQLPNVSIAAHFLELEHARDYKADIEILKIVPNIEVKTFDIIRYYPC